jgi:hypothetical protein
MKQFLLLLMAGSLTQVLKAQHDSLTILQQIDQQIWIPYMQGVERNDASQYNGINSTAFYWVVDGKKPLIMNHSLHVADAARVMNKRKEQGISTRLEVRFVERNVSDSFASEQVLIQSTLANAEGKTETGYSRVHVFSKLENGKWKRWIVHYLGSATPEAFAAASSLLLDTRRSSLNKSVNKTTEQLNTIANGQAIGFNVFFTLKNKHT